MKKLFLLLLFSLFLSLTLFAQIPTGYYNSAIGKKQAELKTALHLIIMNATPPSYGSGAGSTWGAFTKTDVRPDDGTVWDMYTNNRVAFNGTSAASGMNIEHSLANSWWGGTKGQTYNDLFNLNPSNSSANSSKGSWPIAVVDGTATYDNGVIKVGKSNSRPGGTIDAWEPADEYKGDFARSYMYMVTSYEDFSTKWTGNSVNQLDNNTYPVFEQWTVDLFLKWSAQDPVSQKEIDRNNEVYKIQGNRNPYIDYPLMAEYVWGKLSTVPFSLDGNVTFPYLSSPSSGANIDFGKVIYLQTDTAGVFIKASNLTGDLILSISGTDASAFSVSNTIVPKSTAESGFRLMLNFTAQTVGLQTATLTISGGGITATSVNLKVNASDEFVALPASNINQTGFTANWTVSANASGYSLNVFSLQKSGTTQAKTIFEEDFLGGMPAGWSTVSGTYSDVLTASNIRLASSGSGGKVLLPALNLSTPGTVLTVRARQYNNDTGAPLTATIDNLPLAVWNTGATNQDFTASITGGTNASVIALSANTSSRVYIDYVKIETPASVENAISVQGYPKSVGNVFSYAVSGLSADSTYYYTLTPEGNGVNASNQITVRTGLKSNIEEPEKATVHWIVLKDGIIIQNTDAISKLILFDLTGKPIHQIEPLSGNIKLNLYNHGIYLLQLIMNSGSETCKIVF